MAILKEYEDNKKHVHVLSYGGGTQSTALLLMALKGEINGVIPDYIIFADTGWEPANIYKWIDKVNIHIKKNYGKEIHFASDRNIREDIMNVDTGKTNKFLTIPAFIKNEDGSVALGRRQCTNDYKIRPIRQKIRSLLGYEPRKWVKEMVHIWKGISTDEIRRVKPARDRWQTAEHPLIEVVEMDRKQCIEYVENEGLGTPSQSSCIGCPFHDNQTWYEIKMQDPESWKDAVFIDKKLREQAKESNLVGEPFLHRSCLPLDEIDFEAKLGIFEPSGFDNECEGMCGI